MPTNRKGLSIKTTQPFIDHKHNHVTPKKLSMLPAKEHHCKIRKAVYSALPDPRKYYAKVLLKFYPRKKQATALCPFHKQLNPSFSVNLRYGKFFCFSCGVSGRDIIDFHQRLYGINFVKAVKELGGKHE
ncbi:MAG: hypothetical protein RLZZ225_299 [Pseudomonadota bacterium]|jgi:hypothetical protein